MRKVSLPALVVLAGLPQLAGATSVGYWPWYARVQGTVQHQGRAVSLRDELGFDNSSSHGFLVDEGWLRLSYMPLDYAGTGILSEETQFGGTTFSEDTQVHSTADITDLGARFLWMLGQRLGAGVTVKVLDGEFEVEDEDGNTDRKTFSEVFPMLSVTFSQPLLDLFELDFEASYIGYEDNWVLELGGAISVPTDYVTVRMGFQQYEYDISDNGSQLDARAVGAFAKLIFDLG